MKNKLRGVILGCAVGDSLGLPAEGLKPNTIKRLGWDLWRQRLFFGKGMVSDDTEHTCFVAQALLKCNYDANAFQKSLAWKLRFWLLGAPAGIGFGTLRAIIKLWLGFPPSKSGVFSAGNGPAMRSAIIGARFSDQADLMQTMVKASTEITHSDPKAYMGALAIAQAAAFGITYGVEGGGHFEAIIRQWKCIEDADNDWLIIVNQIEDGLTRKISVQEFAAELGLAEKGVTGYIYHTVPVVLYAWLHHYGDFKKTLVSVMNCGGDTDTTGAIVGAIAGSVTGEDAIPKQWIDDIIEWPRSVSVMRSMGNELAQQIEGENVAPIKYFGLGQIVRNIFFTAVVLVHGIMRILPVWLRRIVIAE